MAYVILDRRGNGRTVLIEFAQVASTGAGRRWLEAEVMTRAPARGMGHRRRALWLASSGGVISNVLPRAGTGTPTDRADPTARKRRTARLSNGTP
jgi:hypothetical protein